MTLPPVEVSFNWSGPPRGRGGAYAIVSGLARPLATYYVETPADDCFSGMTRPMYGGTGVADADGRFSRRIDVPPPGAGVQLAFYTPQYHRIYKQVIRSQAQVYVHTDRIGGLANPGTSVALTVLDGTGVERARTRLSAGDRGLFDAQLRNAAGQPIAIMPGDHVVMETDEGLVDIPVEELTLDFSPSSGLVGASVPNRPLDGQEPTRSAL